MEGNSSLTCLSSAFNESKSALRYKWTFLGEVAALAGRRLDSAYTASWSECIKTHKCLIVCVCVCEGECVCVKNLYCICSLYLLNVLYVICLGIAEQFIKFYSILFY